MSRMPVTKAELHERVAPIQTMIHRIKEEDSQLVLQNSKTKKSARTKEKILQVAAELISTRANFDFQMGEIAEALGVAKGSLYYYFKDKDALVTSIFRRKLELLTKSITQAADMGETPHDALVNICLAFAENVKEGPVLAAMATDLIANHKASVVPLAGISGLIEISSVIERELLHVQVEGKLRPDIDCSFVAFSACGVFLFAGAQRRAKEGKDFDVEKFTFELIDFLCVGIESEAPRES